MPGFALFKPDAFPLVVGGEIDVLPAEPAGREVLEHRGCSSTIREAMEIYGVRR
jgi:hypothetical protein